MCLVHSNCPVIIITSHLLFLKVHFLVKPNAYLLGKFAAQRAENNKLTQILCTTVGRVALLMLKKKACVVQYNLTWPLSPHSATPERPKQGFCTTF